MKIRKAALGMVVAAGLFGGIQGASAQSATNPVLCRYQWCWTQVQVVQDSAGMPMVNLTWNQLQMQKKMSGVTHAWILVGSPDYEFRAGSVVITGPNAPGSSAQFPLREVSPNRYALDDLNTTDLTYAYEVRVYKKGTSAGTPPLTATGTIVNSFN